MVHYMAEGREVLHVMHGRVCSDREKCNAITRVSEDLIMNSINRVEYIILYTR